MKIEAQERRRNLDAGFKVYGTQAEFEAMRDRITTALNAGLVTGWIGFGEVDGKTVFPNNGRNGVPETDWLSENR